MKYPFCTGVTTSLLLTSLWSPTTIGVDAVPTGWEDETNIRKSTFSNVLHVLGKLSSKLLSSEEHVSHVFISKGVFNLFQLTSTNA